jgi:hypothetical protein
MITDQEFLDWYDGQEGFGLEKRTGHRRTRTVKHS